MTSGATPQLLKVYMAQAPGSDGVEELQLRKQTPLDRIWCWLVRRPVPVVGSWQHHLLELFNSVPFSILVVIMTLLALFLVDICVLAMSYQAKNDTAVGATIFACFLFFLIEILGSILVQDDYFLSFFFFCDFVGTLSLIFDIPWITNPAGINLNSKSTAVLRASRIARTGTRATRVLRLLRTMRLPAVMRCCKADDIAELEDVNPNEDLAMKTKREQQQAATHQIVNTNVGSKLQLVVSKRVIFLVTIMLFVIPLLTDSEVDHSRTYGLAMLESVVKANSAAFDTAVSSYLLSMPTCIYVYVIDQHTPSVVPDLTHIRPTSLSNVTTSSGESYALFDLSAQFHNTTSLTIGMTAFTIVLFAGGSILFTQDAERLFFKPIERMVGTIRRLANIMFEMDSDSDELALDETLLIEAVVSRVSDMFNVRMDRDGVKRKTTVMKTVSSRWRIHVEEEECDTIDLDQPVKNKDLLLTHEIEELASLPRCLESPTCSAYLSQYLRAEYAVENVLFLQEVKHYRTAAEKLAHQSRQIFSLFISDQAVNQVAVEWGLRRAVSQNLKTQMAHLADLFHSVEHEIMVMLTRDAWPKFLNSIYCLRLLKHLTLERQQQQQRYQAHARVQATLEQDNQDDVAQEAIPNGLELDDMNAIRRALETG